jgi:hypothetical protein
MRADRASVDASRFAKTICKMKTRNEPRDENAKLAEKRPRPEVAWHRAISAAAAIIVGFPLVLRAPLNASSAVVWISEFDILVDLYFVQPCETAFRRASQQATG